MGLRVLTDTIVQSPQERRVGMDPRLLHPSA